MKQGDKNLRLAFVYTDKTGVFMMVKSLAKTSKNVAIAIFVVMSIVAVLLMLGGKMLFAGCLILIEFVVGSIVFVIGEIADVCSDY